MAKKFAYYTRQTAGCGSLDEVDQIPVMLTSSIITSTVPGVSNTLSAQTQPPPGKKNTRIESEIVLLYRSVTFTDLWGLVSPLVTSLAPNEAGDCQTSASPQVCSQQPDLEIMDTSNPAATER